MSFAHVLQTISSADPSHAEAKNQKDFLSKEYQGYEQVVLNKETKKEEKETGIIKLTAYEKSETLHYEKLTYKLFWQGESYGEIIFRIDLSPRFPDKDLYISTLYGSSSLYHCGLNYIKFAVELSHRKGFKGALSLRAHHNSPGFYWLAGLTNGDDFYHPPKFDKVMVARVTQKFHSKMEDKELETDDDCKLAKLMLASEMIKSDPDYRQAKMYRASWLLQSKKETLVAKITIQELKTQWPKLLRSRFLYEKVFFPDRVMDELALSRLNLPRFKEHENEEFHIPDNRRFHGTWRLRPMSVPDWEKLVVDRHAKLEEHMEKIKRNEIMSEKQFFAASEASPSANTSVIPIFQNK